MNEYAHLDEFKAYADISQENTDHDTLIRMILSWSSRQMERYTSNFFYQKTETRRFDCPSKSVLYFDRPLLSLTTLTNGNSVEITSSNYFLYPDSSNEPFMWLEIDKSSGVAWEYSDTPQQAVTVAGLWGWHEEYDDAWEDSGATVSDSGGINASATTLTPSGEMPTFDFQQMLRIGTEQIYVSSKAAATLTIQRAKNGSTAAAHDGTAIEIYRPQYDIRMLCLRLAMWRYKQKDASFETTGHPELGMVTVPAALPKDIAKDLARFKWM